MRFCVSCRENKDTLIKANEILVEERDKNIIGDLAHDYPDKNIIYSITGEPDVQELKQLNLLAQDRLIVEIRSYDKEYYTLLKNNNIKCAYYFPVISFATLKELVNRGVEYIKIDRPLTFNIEKVKNFKTQIKLNPISAAGEDPVLSGWVRPEDIHLYEPCTIEIDNNADLPNKTKALMEVYSNGSWPGSLDLLIPNLPTGIKGENLPPEFGKTRSVCGHRCMESLHPSCHYCIHAIKLSDIKDEIIEIIDNR